MVIRRYQIVDFQAWCITEGEKWIGNKLYYRMAQYTEYIYIYIYIYVYKISPYISFPAAFTWSLSRAEIAYSIVNMF